MSRGRRYRGVALMFAMFAVLVGVPIAPAAAKPNIVMVVADDLGPGHLKAYNPATPINTPNISGIASAGLRFTSYYTQAMCTPSRYAMLSGRDPHRDGNGLDWAYGYNTQQGIPSWVRLLPGELRAAGYRTGIVGKWHLGQLPQFRPLEKGFDYFHGSLLGEGGYWDHLNHGIVDWWNQNTRLQPDGIYSTDGITKEAVEFIAGATGPFFLYVSYQAPHTPYDSPSDPKAGPNSIFYPAIVQRMDTGIGRLGAALRAKGVYQNTIIIFVSDNGAAMLQYGGNTIGTVKQRGGKEQPYNGALRVAGMISWPGHIRQGVSDEVISGLDWYATVLALTGTALPQNQTTNGTNISGVLSSAAYRLPPRMLHWQAPNAAWKATLETTGTRLKVVQRGAVQPELYQIQLDPSETRNVAGTYPSQVTRLMNVHNTWANQHGR